MPDYSDKDISSAGMDKKINKSYWTPKRIAMIVGGVAIVALFVYSFVFMDVRSTLNVDREKLTVSTIEQGTFQEFISQNGTVEPIRTTYIDAAEGGTVDQIYLQSGAMVEEGDTILTLNNPELELTIMQRTGGYYEQLNSLRDQRYNLERRLLNLQSQLANARHSLTETRNQYERDSTLYQEGAIPQAEFRRSRDDYRHQQEIFRLEQQSTRNDSVSTQNQLEDLQEEQRRVESYLEATQDNLDNLTVTAPVDGQLTMNEFNAGQSINRGTRIGQVDVLDSYKLRVNIDEYHLQRITTGLRGTWDFNGSTYVLEITRIYPTIENGQFQVEMQFVDQVPDGLRRGLTARIRLELGESAQALLLPKGGFFQTSGGNWVYLLSDDGSQAVRHDIRIGRQNPEYFEVLGGLEEGDRVITSSYETFGDNEVLNLQ
ncbi:MAG: efflux RND transporter periplasmic adaptor subunit [Balneolaceae bacterium]|nr:efflux RND transporter periplasmic adaptor subunit [Balneolaceae bacterium]